MLTGIVCGVGITRSASSLVLVRGVELFLGPCSAKCRASSVCSLVKSVPVLLSSESLSSVWSLKLRELRPTLQYKCGSSRRRRLRAACFVGDGETEFACSSSLSKKSINKLLEKCTLGGDRLLTCVASCAAYLSSHFAYWRCLCYW